MTERKSIESADRIAGLAKGLHLIEAFNETHPRLSASTAARRTGLSRTAARRYLLTLHELGYLDSDGQLFWLTPRVLRLGWSYFDSARVPRTVQPFLQQLSQDIGGVTVSFGVLDGDDLMFVARNVSGSYQSQGFMLGARVPANLASAGIALLACKPHEEVEAWLEGRKFVAYTPQSMVKTDDVRAAIDRARTEGYAMLEQQLERDRRGIAVAIQARSGETIGAISVSLAVGNESSRQAVDRVVPKLRQAQTSLWALL